MKKALAISLAMLVLLGSLSVTFGTHYCMGKPVASEWMVGHQDLSCGMTSTESTISFEETSISMDCCSDEHISFENGELFKHQIKDVSLSVPFVANLVQSLPFEFAPNNRFSFADSSPPPIGENLLVLHQAFLI